MALSIVTIPGDGVSDTFNVSFALGILDRNSVTAWVTGELDGGGNKIFRTITYLTDTMLKISGTPAGVGINVVFTRTTSNSQLIVDYEDGDIMNETNLNTAQKQAIMLVHQVLDGRFSAFIQDVSAGGFKITNLGTPIAGTDATNKAYVDGLISTGAASAAAAAASAAAALASQNSAAVQAGIATAQATLAQQWATNPEDVVVSGGLFSAFHWAQKAAAFVLGDISGAVHSSPVKASIVNADEVMILDSAASFGVKRTTWTNIKTFLSAAYAALVHTHDAADINSGILADARLRASLISAPTANTTDCNLAIANGWYRISGAANAPNANPMILETRVFDTNFRVQYAHEHPGSSSDTKTWRRDQSGGVWNAWYVIRMAIPELSALFVLISTAKLQKEYVSAQQTITAAGTLTLAHSLGAKPTLVQAVLQCTTAQGGYSIGDEVYINPHSTLQAGSSRGISVVPDATNLNVKYGSDATGVFTIIRKDTGNLIDITNGSWRLVLRAWL